MKRILLVEDEEETAALCQQALVEAGYKVEYARTGEYALELAENLLFDLAILDVGVPGATGFEIAERLRTHHPETGVVIMTGFSAVDPAVAKEVGAGAFLQKPFSIEKLLRTVTACLNRQKGV